MVKVSARLVLLATGFWSVKRVKVDGGEGSFVASNTQVPCRQACVRNRHAARGRCGGASSSARPRAPDRAWCHAGQAQQGPGRGLCCTWHARETALRCRRSRGRGMLWLPAPTRECMGCVSLSTAGAAGAQGKRKLARSQRRGRETRQPVAVGAIVSNHIGWADILIHMCAWLPSFVARHDTTRLPFIGVTRHTPTPPPFLFPFLACLSYLCFCRPYVAALPVSCSHRSLGSPLPA